MLDWVLGQSAADMWSAFELLAELIGDVRKSTDTVVSNRMNAWWQSATDAVPFLRRLQREFRGAVEIQLGKRLVDGRWISDHVLALANTIDDHHFVDRLPILADALEEAGCDDRFVLDHLRSTASHNSACFVVDGILYRQ
jgi:hypothetical protein